MKKLFTTESVTCGHPDKMCDFIADQILDAYLEQDKDSRVACEVCASLNQVLVMGEITSKGVVDIYDIVRKTIVQIGYDDDSLGFNGNTIPIHIDLNQQSLDIARGVNKVDIGAGDQGIMYGYATNETENFMPLVHDLASKLARRLEYVRREGLIKGLRPDGKVQVTLSDDDKKVEIEAVVVSAQHNPDVDLTILRKEIQEKVIHEVIPSHFFKSNTKIYINPTGRFVIGGPVGDSGLTGRKICVDTYGGITHHGGGAFSGKDYTKVDRSAAYYCRYVAKNIVASGLASQCEVSVSYAIGISEPLAISIDTFNTSTIKEEQILDIIHSVFDFRLSHIIEELDLKNVKYSKTTLYSHFGKDGFPWEKLDKVSTIKDLLKIKNYS